LKETTADELIPVHNIEEVRTLLGPLDSNTRLIRDLFGVNVLSREGGLRLLGKPEDVLRVRRVLEQGLESIRANRGLTTAEFARLIRGDRAPRVPAEGAVVAPRVEPGAASVAQPRTPGQRDYVDAMRAHDVVFGIGPAGTGKTFLAVAAAIEAVKLGGARRIVLVRPAVEAGEKLGFLPGDYQAKVDPYLRPLYDALHDLVEPSARARFLGSDVLEISPLAYMRGRTLNDSFVILDEAQNATIPQMLMFLTRLGTRSRMVVTGDPTQVDLPPHVPSGLADAVERLESLAGIAVVRMSPADIVRHPVVERIIGAYEPRRRRTDGA
jgi:phosphate starvation-inducible PhoH-like protein